MKNRAIKKCLSIVLVMIAIFSITGGGWQIKAEAASCNCDYTPVIYVHGHQALFKTDENGNRIQLGSDDDEAVEAAVKEVVPLFIKAVAVGTDEAWQEYIDRFLELFPKFYEEFAPNLDGSPKEGTGNLWTWDYNSINANHRTNDVDRYHYEYDYRLSLYDEAEKLNAYIEAVKQKTGHDKVVLIGRCGGTNLVSAYLVRYQKPINYAGVEKVIHLCSMADGVDFMEAAFTGNVKINAEAAYRWLQQNDLSQFFGEEITGYLNTVLDMLESTGGGFTGACMLMNRIYEKLKDPLIAPFIKSYPGLNAGFVAFVNEGYDDFKNYVFSEEGDLEKYAQIIEYLDWYHYEVQAHDREDMLAMKDAGVEVDIITYYGDQVYPLYDGASLAADTVASVYDQSFGAKSSLLLGTLSDSEIAAREAEGNGKYISPDKQIDGSDALFPDNTWYVKNVHHVFHHGAVSNFLMAMARTKNVTVDTLAGYPQFLNYNTETQVFSPLQEKNENDTDWAAMEENAKENGIPNFIQMMTEFFQRLIDKFMDFLYIILGPLGLMTKD